MQNKTKRILLISYLSLVFIITLVLAFLLTKEGKGFSSILATIDIAWLLASFGCMMLYLVIESWAVFYLTSFMYKKMNFFYIMKVNIIGNYYGAITPAAMGFQPSQIAYLKRDGVPVGISTFIQTLKMMAYEVIIVVLCVVFLSIRGQFFIKNYPEIFWLSIFGASINIFIVAVAITAIVKREALKKMVLALSKFLAKIKILKDKEKVKLTVEKTLDEFHGSAKYLSLYKWKVMKVCLLTILQWIMFFAIPYCLYNSFGLGMLFGQQGVLQTVTPLDEAVSLIALAAFLFLAVHFVPIPGSSGANEVGFGIFFGKVFTSEAAAALFIWRIITYYSVIALGFIIILIDGVSHNRNKNKTVQTENNLNE